MIKEPSNQDQILAAPSRWRSKKLWLSMTLLTGATALSVSVLSGFANSSKSVNAARLQIAEVTRGTLVRDASVEGHLVAAVSPTLYAPANATVNLKVKAGDTVQAGQIVAELESPDLSNALQREQAIYAQMQAEIERQRILARKQKLLAQRDADQAEIDRVAAERTYQRIESAGVAGVIAKIDFLKAQDALKSAEIRAKHASSATRLEQEDVELSLKTRLAQLAQQRLARDNAQRHVDELKLRAPMAGLVGTLSVGDRTVVAANTALMTLVDLSHLEVELAIPETWVADLGLGMTVEIAINERKALATLSAIAPEVVKNQVLARARFSGTQPTGLRQSQRVAARLLIDEKPNTLTLQRGPFVEHEGGRFVYALANGIAQRKPITMGATSVGQVEILAGLKAGDKVVVSGTELFDNAASIQINP
jgi:HlyD family secretion protein